MTISRKALKASGLKPRSRRSRVHSDSNEHPVSRTPATQFAASPLATKLLVLLAVTPRMA